MFRQPTLATNWELDVGQQRSLHIPSAACNANVYSNTEPVENERKTERKVVNEGNGTTTNSTKTTVTNRWLDNNDRIEEEEEETRTALIQILPFDRRLVIEFEGEKKFLRFFFISSVAFCAVCWKPVLSVSLLLLLSVSLYRFTCNTLVDHLLLLMSEWLWFFTLVKVRLGFLVRVCVCALICRSGPIDRSLYTQTDRDSNILILCFVLCFIFQKYLFIQWDGQTLTSQEMETDGFLSTDHHPTSTPHTAPHLPTWYSRDPTK